MQNDILFSITVEDLQTESLEKIGRTLNDNEILIAKKRLESGLLSSIPFIYSAIFSELLDNNDD